MKEIKQLEGEVSELIKEIVKLEAARQRLEKKLKQQNGGKQNVGVA